MDTDFGCITLPLVPGRKEPSDRSEMVTQLMFGESYRVLEKSKKWILVRNGSDDYECWIDRKQHFEVNEPLELAERVETITSTLKTMEGEITLPMGARVHRGEFKIGDLKYNYTGQIAGQKAEPTTFALALLGAPYLWGGKSVLGVDCSGFVQVVYDCCGISLPRDAYQQAEKGESVDFVDTAEPGDIAYFDNDEGQITHVGILLGKGKIIHASGSVRIDSIDHQGIFNTKQKTYTHKLRIIKRVK